MTFTNRTTNGKPEINVVPINDLREHQDCKDCHCKPKVEVRSDRILIIHNAYDHRELFKTISEN